MENNHGNSQALKGLPSAFFSSNGLFLSRSSGQSCWDAVVGGRAWCHHPRRSITLQVPCCPKSRGSLLSCRADKEFHEVPQVLLSTHDMLGMHGAWDIEKSLLREP